MNRSNDLCDSIQGRAIKGHDESEARATGKKGSFLWTHPELNRTPFAEPSKCEANVINQLHHVPLAVLDIRSNLDLVRQANLSYAS